MTGVVCLRTAQELVCSYTSMPRHTEVGLKRHFHNGEAHSNIPKGAYKIKQYITNIADTLLEQLVSKREVSFQDPVTAPPIL